MSSETVEVLLKSATTTIGEGPHWEESSGSLLYVDILSDAVHRYHVETGKKEMIKLDGCASLIVPTQVKDCYVVSSLRKLCHLNWSTEECTDIVEVPPLGTNDRLNDGKCDAAGRLWAGTMGHEVVPGQPELNKGKLFCLDKNKLKTAFEPVSISNGLAWTADNTRMFYIDSIPRHVYVFNFDLQTGAIDNKAVAVDFNQWSVEEAGLPDGMCIDQAGKLWVAGYYSGKVMQFDPETGKMLRKVSVPGRRTTSCCFGGKDFSELYVTCASQGYTEEELRTVDPLAGSIFRVTGLGSKGQPGNIYHSP